MPKIISLEDTANVPEEPEILEKLLEGKLAITRGEIVDAYEGLAQIRQRYELEG